MKDAQIIDNILNNDPAGLEYVYSKARPMVHKLVRRNSGTKDEAEDVLQDSVLIFWRKLTEENLVLSCKITTYLYSVAWNVWRKELKHKAKFDKSEEDLDIAVEEYETVLERQERIEIIRECISELSDSNQLVMNKFLEGESSHQLAESCGYKNADVAKTARYKAQQKLAEIVKEKYGIEDVTNY